MVAAKAYDNALRKYGLDLKRLNFQDDKNDDTISDNDDPDVAIAETRKRTWTGSESVSINSGSNSSNIISEDSTDMYSTHSNTGKRNKISNNSNSSNSISEDSIDIDSTLSDTEKWTKSSSNNSNSSNNMSTDSNDIVNTHSNEVKQIRKISSNTAVSRSRKPIKFDECRTVSYNERNPPQEGDFVCIQPHSRFAGDADPTIANESIGCILHKPNTRGDKWIVDFNNTTYHVQIPQVSLWRLDLL